MRAIFAVFYRDYRQRITNIAFVFWDMIVPLAYLGLFGVGFEKTLVSSFTIEGQTLGYTAFLLPGILAMITFTVAMNASWGFFMDKDSGIFDELLTYPLTRRQFLIGKVGFNVLIALVGSMLTITAGALTLDAPIRWATVPLTLLGVVVMTSGWFFLFAVCAILLSRMDAFNTVTSVAYIILMFISSMFYPLSGTPTWFLLAARLNPMTWQADILRYTLLGVGSPALAGIEAIAFAVFTLAALAWAVRSLERAG